MAYEVRAFLRSNYVSTTFVLLCAIIGAVLAVFFAVNPFLDWGKILNTGAESRHTLSLLAMIVFTFFALQFIFKLITSIFLADQKSSLVDLIGVLGSLLSLLVIFVLMKIGERSLLYLGFALSASPALVLLAAYFIAFTGQYAKYRPSFKYVNLRHSKALMGLGIMFFIPQLCMLLFFSTSKVIIARLFILSEVTVYNIAFKYFSVVTVFFQIFINPFWSAFTEAFVKEDYSWIKKVIHKLVLIWGLSCIGVLLMVPVSSIVYQLWIGKDIYIPLQVSIGLAIYVCIANWNNIFAFFNNGVSKIFIQVWLALIAGISFIPIAIFASKKIGLMGIPLAMGLSILPGSFISPIQSYKIANNSAKGIWNK